MKAYFLGHRYLSSIQQGIQAAHCLAAMIVYYTSPRYESTPFECTIVEWEENHKTIVLLSAGNSADIIKAGNQLSTFAKKLYLPCGFFQEDEETLNKAVTCAGIIVPEKMPQLAHKKLLAYLSTFKSAV